MGDSEVRALIHRLGGSDADVKSMLSALTDPREVAALTQVGLWSGPGPATLGAATLSSPDGQAQADAPPPRQGTASPATAQAQATRGTALEQPALSTDDRFVDIGLLGRGGMGVVRRIQDRVLGRTMAMKIIHPTLPMHAEARARFHAEAQATAQLQHPGIVPVHDFGQLPDGRSYFTMTEVHGRTLTDVIAQVHQAVQDPRSGDRGSWTLRRLIEVFQRVCETISYAHEKGVIHRDLKPDNIMVGRHGEVLVLDWGLARVQAVLGDGEAPTTAPTDHSDAPVVTDRSRDERFQTQVGAIAGTPAYMSPEQAKGWGARVDQLSDVYSLGAVLYHILAGVPPYQGRVQDVLYAVQHEDPVPLSSTPTASDSGGRGIPEALIAVCQQAMARAATDRYASAAALAGAIRAWMDGVHRREQALNVVEQAKVLGEQARQMQGEARALRARGEALLAELEPLAPEEQKAAAWRALDDAAQLADRAALTDFMAESNLRGALTHHPELPEAHTALIARYQAEHARLEADRDRLGAGRRELLIRRHIAALPAEHPTRRRQLTYLEGDGAISLVTDPPGVEVHLYRQVQHNRRLVSKFVRSLGRTPLRRVSLPMGSYLCKLIHPDATGTDPAGMPYPVRIGREEHWDGVPPGGREPHPIPVPPPGALGVDDCYVPAGWCRIGGDAGAPHGLPARRVWIDGLVMRRFSVTNRDYIAFLDALVQAGREAEALRFVPRERTGGGAEPGAMIYGRRGDGGFQLEADADGHFWQPGWPVMMVDWFGARGFAAWQAAQTGAPWRLPGELEWEKAARGVDGRFYPWGDHPDPTWFCHRSAHSGMPLPAEVTRFPVDESVYGIRGMAGGIIDMCAEPFADQGPTIRGGRVMRSTKVDDDVHTIVEHVGRGGAWSSGARACRSADRGRATSSTRRTDLGFRLCRSLP